MAGGGHIVSGHVVEWLQAVGFDVIHSTDRNQIGCECGPLAASVGHELMQSDDFMDTALDLGDCASITRIRDDYEWLWNHADKDTDASGKDRLHTFSKAHKLHTWFLGDREVSTMVLYNDQRTKCLENPQEEFTLKQILEDADPICKVANLDSAYKLIGSSVKRVRDARDQGLFWGGSGRQAVISNMVGTIGASQGSTGCHWFTIVYEIKRIETQTKAS